MRLINADKIRDCAKYIKINEYFEPYIMVDDLIKLLDEQPTAYDIDKVIEELEENSTDYNELTDDGIKRTQTLSLKDAIEIAKQGGVSDDVCEWKVFDNSLTDEPQWVYETTCGKYVGEEHTSKAFVYCPYCGKKIKVVE